MVREERLVHVPAARRLAVGGAAVARLRPEVRAAEELLHQLEAFGILVGAAQQLLVDLDVVLEQGGHQPRVPVVFVRDGVVQRVGVTAARDDRARVPRLRPRARLTPRLRIVDRPRRALLQPKRPRRGRRAADDGVHEIARLRRELLRHDIAHDLDAEPQLER